MKILRAYHTRDQTYEKLLAIFHFLMVMQYPYIISVKISSKQYYVSYVRSYAHIRGYVHIGHNKLSCVQLPIKLPLNPGPRRQADLCIHNNYA